jgi:hypothetical protein
VSKQKNQSLTAPRPKQPAAKQVARKTVAGGKPAPQPLEARNPRLKPSTKLGIGAIAVVIVAVVGLVVASMAGGSGSSGPGSLASSSPPAGTPIAASITNRLASIPLSTLSNAPTGGVVVSPQHISDPSLTSDGKPELLYIGAEFCPVCATERWAMYVALSKFGTFSPQPGQIHSALRDGDIPTLTFFNTTYSSPYLTFTPVETTTNQPDGNYYVSLQAPTQSEMQLWQSHTSESFPWLDLGGKLELSSAQYDPSVLEGLSFDSIASQIGDNSTTVGADVDASAKVLIKSICGMLTNNKPAAVCNVVD